MTEEAIDPLQPLEPSETTEPAVETEAPAEAVLLPKLKETRYDISKPFGNPARRSVRKLTQGLCGDWSGWRMKRSKT